MRLALFAFAIFGASLAQANPAPDGVGWSADVYTVYAPPPQTQVLQFRLRVERYVFNSGVDDLASWPVKSRAGQPISFDKFIQVQDLSTGSITSDFTSEMKNVLNQSWEYRYPILNGRRMGSPTIKRNCHGQTSQRTGWIPDIINVWNVFEGSAQGCEPTTGGWARHDLGLLYLSAGHSSSLVVLEDQTIGGQTFSIVKYVGKYGFYALYYTDIAAIESVYDDSTVHYCWN